ncbi:MAG: hypothetical protein KAI24_08700 [Planctomycetes bacterium]|nr:hypothetical protein [Planctomycetota bacterium]
MQAVLLVGGGRADDALVSYAGTDFGEQVQAIWWQTQLPLADRFGDLRDGIGRAIWEVLQWLATTEVDGMCTEDPEGFTQPATFGVPLQDTVTSPRLGFSAHAERVHVGGIPSNTHETVRLTCTISGWADLDATVDSTVYLVVQHPGQSVESYTAPTSRLAGQDTFTFEVDLAWPLGNTVPTVLTIGMVPVDGSPSQVSWSLGVRRE